MNTTPMTREEQLRCAENPQALSAEDQRRFVFSFPIETLWQCWPKEHKGVIYLQAMLAAIEAPAEPGEANPLDELERFEWYVVLEQSKAKLTDRQRELCPVYRQHLDEDPEAMAAACNWGRWFIRTTIDLKRKQTALNGAA